MLDSNAGTHTAYLAQAQPSNFLLPGKPGSPSIGTTIGHSSARPLMAPREQAETGLGGEGKGLPRSSGLTHLCVCAFVSALCLCV